MAGGAFFLPDLEPECGERRQTGEGEQDPAGPARWVPILAPIQELTAEGAGEGAGNNRSGSESS